MTVTAPFADFKTSRERLISLFLKDEIHGSFQEKYTNLVDHYFRRSLQESRAGERLFGEKKRFALVAVGGYGRKELCIHSDLDVLVIFESAIPHGAKQLAHELFFPLWDLGADLGHGIRTIKDCISLAAKDFEVLTSLLDARFLSGDSSLYLTLMEDLQKKVFTKKARLFGRWLAQRDRVRMASFGDASFLLEPHLKEGIGGLRDYHHILWLSKIFFQAKEAKDLEYMGSLSHVEYRDLEMSLQFIWQVRNHLHHSAGRHNDRLGLEYQENIARTLGYGDRKDFLAVEQFMGRLHASMAVIKALHRTFLDSHLGKPATAGKSSSIQDLSPGIHVEWTGINFNSATVPLNEPTQMMNAFLWAARLGRPLAPEAKRLVREFLFLVEDTFRGSTEVREAFFEILDSGNASEAFDQMYETGFLEALIPEFSRIKDRVQFDTYHIYPVGRHSLRTLWNLKHPFKSKDILIPQVFSDLRKPQALYLAGLLHDIGKTATGHAERGSRLASRILGRFHCESGLVQDVAFLVRHHLLLAETATRRDLNDEKVVILCARTIGSISRLKMLYLLTWADSKATGPRAWNEWISSLVQELFFKVLHLLEKGELVTPLAFRTIEKTKSQVRHKIPEEIGASRLEGIFELMSPRYLLDTKASEMVRHIRLFWEMKALPDSQRKDFFQIDPRKHETEKHWELVFLAKDRPGLFSDLTGVLALENINILSAHIYTWRDGTAVDIFKVTAPLDPLFPDRIWKKVKNDLRDCFAGETSLEKRLARKHRSSVLLNLKRPTRPPVVIVDNELSDFFTVIEVFADDRVGLLHTITHTLFNLGLDIGVAKIATKADQVADVFYVRDLEGQKVEEPKRVKKVKQDLLVRLTQGLSPSPDLSGRETSRIQSGNSL